MKFKVRTGKRHGVGTSGVHRTVGTFDNGNVSVTCRGGRDLASRWLYDAPQLAEVQRCTLTVLVRPAPPKHILVEHVPLNARQYSRTRFRSRHQHAFGLEVAQSFPHRSTGNAKRFSELDFSRHDGPFGPFSVDHAPGDRISDRRASASLTR